ncbi:MAG: 40S ribosomal protein S19 [archaeon]|nr:40S ribosomal protein S19 [archaeon]
MAGATVYDVEAFALISAVAEKLKKIPGIKAPEESIFWKTACFKETAPNDEENFWFIRSASLLRKLYMRKVIGINKLRKEYGGRSKNHVHKKHSTPASGAIIRRCLQQLETSGLVKTIEGKGRSLTPSGFSLLDKTAMELYKTAPIERFTHVGMEE